MSNAEPNQPQASILVVDDSLPSLKAILAMLRAQGFEVRGAPSGSTALMMIEAEPPDLLLLDVNMPDMDGYELCQQLKDQPETQDIPIIFISGLAEVVDKVKGFAIGGVDYISKPFQVEEVIARIETHLTLRNLQKSLKAQNAQLQQEIIERKRAETELQKAHDELEQRVKERTIELSETNAQLEEEIAERKQMQAALKESETHYRLLIENIPSVIWETSREGETIFISPNVQKIYGFTRQEILEQGKALWFDRIHPDDINNVINAFDLLFSQQIPFDVEYRIQRKDGQWIWLHDSATIVEEKEGQLYAYGVFSDITERKQAAEALLHYAERLRILHDIDQAILAARSPEETAEAALNHIRQLVPCQRASVTLFDFEANEALMLAVSINGDTQLGTGERVALNAIGSLPGLQQGQYHLVKDVLTQPKSSRSDEQLLAESVRSYINIPLVSRGEVIGSLNLGANSPDKFTTEHVDIATEVADQLAITIQQARLFEAEAQRRQEAEMLREATSALTSTLDLNQIIENIMTQLEAVVPYDSTCLFLQEGELLRTVVGRGFPDPEQVLGQNYPVEEDELFEEIRRTGRAIILADVRADPRFLHWSGTDYIRGWMGIPLIVAGKILGYLTFDSRQIAAYSQKDATLAQAFAIQAAAVIENARLYTETEQRAEHLAVLHELDRAISSSLHIDDVYQTFARQTLRLLPYDHMSIILLQDEQLHVTYTAGEESLHPVGTRLPIRTTGIFAWVLAHDQALLTQNIPADTRFETTPTAVARGFQSGMAIPLRVKGRTIGIWSLILRQVAGYNQNDLTIAQSMAEQLAIAIENARLFGQVQHYAKELEQRVVERSRELSVLYDVTAVASEVLDLQTTLEQSLARVLAAMRSNAGQIHLLDDTNKILNLAVQHELPPDLMTQMATVSLDSGLGRHLIEKGEPLIVPDITSDPRMAEISYTGHPKAYVGLPMRASGGIVGVLSLLREATQPQFNVEEMTLLTSIADQVGVVVESTRLRQQAEQTAVLEERARLARELHDSVTQLLYSMNLFAKAGRNAYNFGDMAEVNNCLTELGESAQQALKEMRLLVYELRPPALEQDGLIGALQHRLDAVEGRAGVMTQLLTNQLIELPGRIDQELYQIALEALNNALKHAKATSVTVKIEAGQDEIKLEVTDNGSGFDLDQVLGKGGLGLVSMRERIEKLGGQLTILPVPEQGTTIRARVEVY